MNGGFGMVLDGSENAALRADSMLWTLTMESPGSMARNEGARAMIGPDQRPRLKVKGPNTVDPDILRVLRDGNNGYYTKRQQMTIEEIMGDRMTCQHPFE